MNFFHRVRYQSAQCIFLLSLVQMFPVCAETTNLGPTDDAYTQDGSNNNNTSLRIESSSRTRISYLKFNTSSVTGTYSAATLRLTEGTDPSGGTMTLRFYQGSSNNWTESTITSANAPSAGAQIAVLTDDITDGEVKDINVLPLVNQPGVYTIIIEADSSNFDLAFSSSEGTDSPQLIIESSSGPPSGLPPHGITTNLETEDADSSGLPDVWEALYGAQGIDPNGDSDGDGLSNLQEAHFGTDPFDPYSDVDLVVSPKNETTATVAWTHLIGRPGLLQSSTDLGVTDNWALQGGSTYLEGGMNKLDVDTGIPPSNFFRLAPSSEDIDSDGVPDYLEPLFGFANSSGSANSALQAQSYDTDGDGNPDISVSGDLAAFNEIYRVPEAGKRLTRAQAARLLIQTTFGPAEMSQVDYVAGLGAEAWLDEQIALPPSYTQPYIDAIKIDLDAAPQGAWTDSELSGYNINNGGLPDAYVTGLNFTTSWMRSAMSGEDQLRQRVAFALSQILVASRNAAGLGNQPRATANYYDLFIEHAFGNFEDLLLDVSLHPFMGTYLSHIGNQKANVAAGIYPDENYAREIMQLFSIGLWELHPDGTRILDGSGEPVETYDTTDITNVAEVFTGINFNANNFGGGSRDDGDHANQYMTTAMKTFGTHHDFSEKRIPVGIQMSGGQPVLDGNGKTTRLYHTIAADPTAEANSQSGNSSLKDAADAVAYAEVQATVAALVNHPNCAPFICRQLIQFLVSSNPSPEFVERVGAVFVDNGSGVTGDLEAVVKAILLDEEARNPLQHLQTPYFGHLREPKIRFLHLCRMMKMDRHDQLLFWHWDDWFVGQTLQEAMKSPSVFNFYRPDYSLFGNLSANNLDSPAFGIVNSYTAISFPNYLWRISDTRGLDHYSGNDSWYDGKEFHADWSDLTAKAGNIPDLLDHLSILYCGATLGAESRATITTALQDELNDSGNLTRVARLAAYLVLMSPEGSCTK